MKRVYVIAGESSGDVLGASYVKQLRELYGGDLAFRGLTGPEMAAVGVESFMDASELSYFGLAEVVRHLPDIIRKRRAVLADIASFKPDLLLTVDLPDFSFSVGRQAKKLGIPVVHVNAPTVWAWRPGRAKKVAEFLDGLICLFPFEPPYFTKHNLNAQFLGHPIVARGLPDPEPFRMHHKLGDKSCICLLPGSRVSEIESLSETLATSVKHLIEKHADLHVLLPIAAGHEEKVREKFKCLGDRITFVEPRQRYDAMRAAEFAIAASGTVTLELGVCETPMLVVYKLSPLTFFLSKFLVTAKYAALPNILHDKIVVQEFIQKSFTVENVFNEAEKLLADKEYRDAMKLKLSELRGMLTVTDHERVKRLRSIFDAYLA